MRFKTLAILAASSFIVAVIAAAPAQADSPSDAGQFGNGKNLPTSTYSIGEAGAVYVQMPWLENSPSPGIMNPNYANSPTNITPAQKPPQAKFYGKSATRPDGQQG